jgi:chromosomal replication initiation ATPase DnaA
MTRVRDIIDVWSVQTPRDLRMAVIAEVADRHGVPVEEVMGGRREKIIARARQDSMAAIKARFPNDTLPMIGRLFNRDHTTVLHALRKQRRPL